MAGESLRKYQGKKEGRCEGHPRSSWKMLAPQILVPDRFSTVLFFAWTQYTFWFCADSETVLLLGTELTHPVIPLKTSTAPVFNQKRS